MDTVVEKCLHCGTPLKEPRKLKGFICTYSCRGQHSVEALDGPKYQGAYLGSKNTRKTKALQRLRKASIAGIAFERSNSVTIRIDQPHKKAVGWLMEVAWPAETRKQRWVACVGDHRSEPLTLDETKAAARSLLSTKGAEPRDWIEELNQIAANEVDRAEIARQRRKWPVDLMGGKRGKLNEEERQLCQVILDTERVLTDEDKAGSEALRGDNVQPEYYEDGHPKLPACLDRRKPTFTLVVDNPISQPATEAA